MDAGGRPRPVWVFTTWASLTPCAFQKEKLGFRYKIQPVHFAEGGTLVTHPFGYRLGLNVHLSLSSTLL